MKTEPKSSVINNWCVSIRVSKELIKWPNKTDGAGQNASRDGIKTERSKKVACAHLVVESKLPLIYFYLTFRFGQERCRLSGRLHNRRKHERTKLCCFINYMPKVLLAGSKFPVINCTAISEIGRRIDDRYKWWIILTNKPVRSCEPRYRLEGRREKYGSRIIVKMYVIMTSQ